jgi:hypothetical protein
VPISRAQTRMIQRQRQINKSFSLYLNKIKMGSLFLIADNMYENPECHHHASYHDRIEGPSDLCSCLIIENRINIEASHGLHTHMACQQPAPETRLPPQSKKKCRYTLVFFDMPTNFTIDIKVQNLWR